MRGISLLSEELLAPQEGLCSTEYVNSAPPYKIQWPGIFVPYTEKKGGRGIRDGAVWVKALRYKQEGRGFDSRWCHWNFSLKQTFRAYYGPGVDSASNRYEDQKYFLRGKGGRCIQLTTLPPLRADCLEIWEPQPPGKLRASPGL